MRRVLERTYAATLEPKWVIAVEDCAADCGIFAKSNACTGSVSAVIPVDLHFPGCLPEPIEILKRTAGELQRDFHIVNAKPLSRYLISFADALCPDR